MAKNTKAKQKQYDAKRKEDRAVHWCVVLYPDDLPPNWEEMLTETHVKCILSPYHDKDTNPDGTPKKPHHHCMVSFDNVKTSAQIKEMFTDLFGASATGSIVGVAAPQKVTSATGMVRYFVHMDNPEKVQYQKADIKSINGADATKYLTSASDISAMKKEIINIIFTQGIKSYDALVFMCQYNEQYTHLFDTVTMNTMLFDKIIFSRAKRRHNDMYENNGFDSVTGEQITDVKIIPEKEV